MATYTDTYSSSGTFTWNVPSDVTSISVELWGGGGTGGGSTVNNDGGGGGAGGQYAIKTVSVTSNTAHTVVVAALKAGTTGTAGAGNDSTFDTTAVVAKGGAGGTANNGAGGVGSTTGGVGDTVFKGGDGSAGAVSTRSGGGGGGAGSTGAGGSTTASTTAGTGTSVGGGNGGTGLASGSNAAGNPGNNFGGGGSGGYRTTTTSRAGGSGAQGQAKITFTSATLDQYQQVQSGSAFGFGQIAAVRYRGQQFTPSVTGTITQVAFNRDAPTAPNTVKVYFDTITAGAPTHAVGSELYSFVISPVPVGGYQVFTLPVALSVTSGTQYCFYLSPWDPNTNAYPAADDYHDLHGWTSLYLAGNSEITNNNGSWSTETLSLQFAIYISTTSFTFQQLTETNQPIQSYEKIDIVGY